MPNQALKEEYSSYEPMDEDAGDDESYSSDSIKPCRALQRSSASRPLPPPPTSSQPSAIMQQQQQQQPIKKRRQTDDPEKKTIRREKNREAARRCRKRKLDVVQDLENQLSEELRKYIELERQAAAFQRALAREVASCNTLVEFVKAHDTPNDLSMDSVLDLDQLLARWDPQPDVQSIPTARASRKHNIPSHSIPLPPPPPAPRPPLPPPPPPALCFDFDFDSTHHPVHTHPITPASPYPAFAATPTRNLKILADQAMQKILNPSPYQRPHSTAAPPLPPIIDRELEQQLLSSNLADSSFLAP